tara:strand:+ start:360 stop:1580 length:1221 start_codon:yes stop_codon:yes gene_type:complete
MSYELGIPGRQYRRTTQVLRHEGTEPIEYEELKQDDGFYIFSFPEADEYDFKNIIRLLKTNGITTIGADTELEKAYDLKENKIMKLTDLINEQGSPDENEIIDSLKKILERWEDPQYRGGGEELIGCPRSDHYFEDIRELVEDYEENFYLDIEDTDDVGGEEINESKIKLKDFFINEGIGQNKEEVDIPIPIEGVPDTRMEIEYTDSKNVDEALIGVTISYAYGGPNKTPMVNIPGAGRFTNVAFVPLEMIEDHSNEGQDWMFIAEDHENFIPGYEAGEKHYDSPEIPDEEVKTGVFFTVEVSVDVVNEGSGLEPDWRSIQEIHWDKLKVGGKVFDDYNQENLTFKEDQQVKEADGTPTPQNEQGCTEQEIAEGTCGYGVDGEIGDEPAGPHLIAIVKENLRKLKK